VYIQGQGQLLPDPKPVRQSHQHNSNQPEQAIQSQEGVHSGDPGRVRGPCHAAFGLTFCGYRVIRKLVKCDTVEGIRLVDDETFTCEACEQVEALLGADAFGVEVQMSASGALALLSTCLFACLAGECRPNVHELDAPDVRTRRINWR
jgi:hypothetical protein